MSDRIEILKNSVNNAIRAICPERAILWTEYYKNKLNRNKPVEIQAAEAMCYVLQNKSIEIYPDELVVGNYTSQPAADRIGRCGPARSGSERL